MSKPTSRRVASGAPKLVATQAARIKTSVYLTPEQFRRLGACCLQESMTQSDVVGRLIDERLSGYYVTVRGDRIGDSPSRSAGAVPVESNDRLAAPGEVSDPAGAAA